MARLNSTHLRLLVALLPALLLPPASFAGECIECREHYASVIAQADPSSDDPGVRHAIYCLFHFVRYLDMGYEYFASPTAIPRIQKENESTKDLIWQTLPPFLDSPYYRGNAAKALAYYRWPDSFRYLMECEVCETALTCKAILFAILGDKRAIPWIIEQFQKVDRKYRSRPRFSYNTKMTYLNALYHLASPEILPFISRVIENPRPEKIRPRAEKVRDRIYELFPEAKQQASKQH